MRIIFQTKLTYAYVCDFGYNTEFASQRHWFTICKEYYEYNEYSGDRDTHYAKLIFSLFKHPKYWKFMKSLTILTILSIFLISCNDCYNVKLKNGAIVTVSNNTYHKFKKGDTVCVREMGYNDWRIPNTGQFQDTVVVARYNGVDNYIEYRIGVIQ